MPSINEISIAVNSLFLDITDPMTLSLNKTSFIHSFPNTIFRFESRYEFEFNINPLFRFENKIHLNSFLNKENNLSTIYNDHINHNVIKEMLKEKNETLTLGDFYLDYTIEPNDNQTLIIFNTNSLIFKYEVIG